MNDEGRLSTLGHGRSFALLALLLFAIGFGVNVEVRSALIQNRHTDVGTYFSAAWSIRTGSDPYDARDSNGWHYTYPPLLAVLLAPLADAPPGMHRYWLIPYPLSVGIWYVLSIGFLALGVDQLARALITSQDAGSEVSRRAGSGGEPGSSGYLRTGVDGNPSVHSRRWWTLFFWPILLCLPAICRSVVRGQVGPLWLMLLCMTAVCIIQKKPYRAGLWLAGAICLKLIPVFLLLYPLWRRSGRMLLGTATGLLFGLILIPLTAMGPKQFITANRHYLQSFVLPAVTGGRIDPAMEHELVDPRTSDTQSFVSVLMNAGNIFFGSPRSYQPPLFARIGHWAIASVLIVGTLWAAGWKTSDPISEAIFFAILCVIMLPIAPACHPHYFMLIIPLVMAVMSVMPKSKMWIALLASLPISHMLTTSPGIQLLRDVGLVTWIAMIFCIAAMVLLRSRTHSQAGL